jgi:hypothetical protein
MLTRGQKALGIGSSLLLMLAYVLLFTLPFWAPV